MTERTACRGMNSRRRLVPVQGLRQGAAQGKAEGQDDCAKTKGNPPAVILDKLRGHELGHDQADGRAEQGSHGLAGALPRADQRAAVQRCRLNQEGGGRADLTAQGKALHEAEEHQKRRCPNPNLRIAGCENQTQDPQAHQYKADQHGWASSGSVAVSAEDDGPDGAGDETHREGEQRGHQLRKLATARKKDVPNLGGEQGVGGEVVELQRIAHHCSGDVATGDRRGRHHRVFVVGQVFPQAYCSSCPAVRRGFGARQGLAVMLALSKRLRKSEIWRSPLRWVTVMSGYRVSRAAWILGRVTWSNSHVHFRKAKKAGSKRSGQPAARSDRS